MYERAVRSGLSTQVLSRERGRKKERQTESTHTGWVDSRIEERKQDKLDARSTAVRNW